MDVLIPKVKGSGGRKAPGEEFGMKSLEGSRKRLLKEVKHVQPFRMKRSRYDRTSPRRE